MSDLTLGSSQWAGGTPDTATTLQNSVDEKRAEHINGVAAFAVALQGKLGAAASLIGTKTSLADRLAVAINSDGTLTSAEPGDLCLSARASKTGWLVCDGAVYSRSTFSALFTEIGTFYGAGDGSTTFNVPDFRGRVPIGVGTGAGGGSSGSGLPGGGSALGTIARGTWKGADSVALIEANNGPHSHTLNIDNDQAGSPGGGNRFITSAGAPTSTNPSGTGTPHDNIQPVMGVNFFIKT